jgi:hypothetical protein
METSCVPAHVAADWVLKLLSFCGLATTEQAALVYRDSLQAEKKIHRILSFLRERDYIESLHRPFKPSLHRLTATARRPLQIRAARWDTQVDHKLAVTDAWIALECPEGFHREYRALLPSGQVLSPDALVCLPERAFFLEVQRTPISSTAWAKKRRVYERYMAAETWRGVLPDCPEVAVLSLTSQQPDTYGRWAHVPVHFFSTLEEVRLWAQRLD